MFWGSSRNCWRAGSPSERRAAESGSAGEVYQAELSLSIDVSSDEMRRASLTQTGTSARLSSTRLTAVNIRISSSR
jgi:hypothetical protein